MGLKEVIRLLLPCETVGLGWLMAVVYQAGVDELSPCLLDVGDKNLKRLPSI